MYNIKEFSKKLNISADTVRYYEKIKLTKKAARGPNGYRRYTDSALRIYSFIISCKKFGFTLREIKPILKYLQNPSAATPSFQNLLEQKIADIDQQRKELKKLRSQLAVALDSCLKNDCSLLDHY